MLSTIFVLTLCVVCLALIICVACRNAELTEARLEIDDCRREIEDLQYEIVYLSQQLQTPKSGPLHGPRFTYPFPSPRKRT